MKNKYRKLAVIMLTAVCFAGCQQEDIVYPEPDAKVAETYLTLNELTQSPLQVPGPEGTYILKVISDDKWTLSSSQAWCSVSETEGFKYSQVPVSYSENPWNEPRTAELTFLINESQEIKIVTVEQEASETSLAADSKELQYNIGGGTCIIGFALGGESGNGYNMYKAYQWLKSVEPSRPVICIDADGEWNTDLEIVP